MLIKYSKIDLWDTTKITIEETNKINIECKQSIKILKIIVIKNYQLEGDVNKNRR